ncbi:hypothetical protein MC885_011192 [Smutsia gigantea]|nr:hypothetical protein MC885_011192 [Smutsia gigantea]
MRTWAGELSHVRLSIPGPCGQPSIHSRVLGGNDPDLRRWPWQGSLRVWGSHHCGASPLNRRWVLWASHCFQTHRDPSKRTVQFGKLSSRLCFWSFRAYHQHCRVQDIIMYPEFNQSSLNDIALVRLSASITCSPYIQPVCVLASSSEFQNRTGCWVTGWGGIREEQVLPSPYILQEVQVGIINTTICNNLSTQPAFQL